jgi:membrane protein DedA with SNARE-associated domain
MSLSEQLLTALIVYGLPVLFGVIFFASVGFPLPATLLVIAAGSFVEQGALDLGWVASLAIVAAVLGDHTGYLIGRWGGRRVVLRLTRWAGGEPRLQQAEAATKRWGGLGIFLSRWLFTPIGPALNLTSGIALYPWPRFTAFDIAGEVLWVALYVTVGRIFSDRVEAMSDLLGDATWAILGLVAVMVLGWKLVQTKRLHRSSGTKRPRVTPPVDVSPQPVREEYRNDAQDGTLNIEP